MSDNEKHQINLKTEPTNTENTNEKSSNPPLMDYMEKPKNKNGVILVGIVSVITILIISITGYYIYSYLKGAPKSEFKKASNEPAKVEIVEEPEELASDTNILPNYLTPEKDDYEGILVSPGEITNYNKAKPSQSQSTTKPATPTVPTTPAPKPSPLKEIDGIVTGWKPNNYRFGDIKGSTYLVIKGDTLWEISEGKYGKGPEWKKIQNANQIGYLANGNPLILPGQNLALPQ